MLKWQVNSAIGRGRPLCGEFAKVADGIAASLRQFHVSVSLADHDEVKKGKSWGLTASILFLDSMN
jgi:hypothetical protein